MVVRLIVQTLVSFGIMGLLLFLGAGTADWLAAWVFLVEMIVLSIVGGLWLIRHDPALVQIEEKALRAGLKGYEDYARRVRYRLIPLIW
jgi:protein-S-isoprenylcysteine O-methyltransferase Ste14